MAPSKKELEGALIKGTQAVFKEDPDTTSVNKVRKHVEEELDLEEGFFTGETWKQRSKELIKEHVEKLLDGGVPDAEPEANTSNGKSSKASQPKPKPKSKPKPKKKAVLSDEEDLSEGSSPSPSKKRKRNNVKEEDEDDVESNVEDEEENSGEEEAKEEANNESDEYSDVIDIVPAPKRKKKNKDDANKPASKPTAKKASSPDDSDEAEIKKLQSQLTKCGVRKLWHNELKKYGDDSRAKIRHLRKMLTDVGMDGRFSEAKAREIKETRELLAEAEAAQEMNALWGMESGGRSSRHKSRGVKMVESDESGDEENGKEKDNDDNDNDEDDDDEEFTFAARRRKAQADLAFLGDEDSESD